uniref:Uncharacterized protein n=1 Tax=Rhizophora mucronata TaxID=61149 RepID=A0A2P2NYF5_RHIMU
MNNEIDAKNYCFDWYLQFLAWLRKIIMGGSITFMVKQTESFLLLSSNNALTYMCFLA